MTKVIEEHNEYRVARDKVRCPAVRPVLLQYVIARQRNKGPELFSFPVGSDEETLAVFSSERAAQSFALSNTLGWEWYPRACSAGELVSLLLGPYAGIEWVLLDPLPGCLAAGDTPAKFMRWESFVDYLLG